MPEAKLPTNAKGWVAAMASSMVGFISGLVALKFINSMWGG